MLSPATGWAQKVLRSRQRGTPAQPIQQRRDVPSKRLRFSSTAGCRVLRCRCTRNCRLLLLLLLLLLLHCCQRCVCVALQPRGAQRMPQARAGQQQACQLCAAAALDSAARRSVGEQCSAHAEQTHRQRRSCHTSSSAREPHLPGRRCSRPRSRPQARPQQQGLRRPAAHCCAAATAAAAAPPQCCCPVVLARQAAPAVGLPAPGVASAGS
jgi:hypothetical protein